MKKFKEKFSTPVFTIVKVAMFLFVCFIIFLFQLATDQRIVPATNYSKYPHSTIKREPADPSLTIPTEYFINDTSVFDDLEIENIGILNEGLKHFHQKTNIQPVVYLTDRIKTTNPDVNKTNPNDEVLDDYSQQIYDKLFDDDAHILLMYFNSEHKPTTYRIVVGDDVADIFDSQAIEILKSHLWYDDPMYEYKRGRSDEIGSYEEYFSLVFGNTADIIMDVSFNPYTYVIIGISGLIVLWDVFVWWRNNKQLKIINKNDTVKE